MTTRHDEDRRGTVYAPVQPGRDKPRRNWFMRLVGFFDTTGKVIAAVTAFVTAIVGVFALVNQLRGTTPGPGPGPTPTAASNELVVAEQVRHCEQLHDMSSSRQVDRDPDGRPTGVRSCQWPPTPYTDPDGYTVITVQTVKGPGAYEATTATLVDRIQGPCQEFVLSYDYGKMGSSDHLPAFLAEPGDLLFGGDGEPYHGKVSELSFYPERNEVDVLRNSSYILATARCNR